MQGASRLRLRLLLALEPPFVIREVVMKHKILQSSTKRKASQPASNVKNFRNPDGSFRRADRVEMMNENDWDVIKSYIEQTAKRDNWLDGEDRSLKALLRKAKTIVVYRAKMEWDTSSSDTRKHAYVPVDTMYITVVDLTGEKRDERFECSTDWARNHYRTMRHVGFTEISNDIL